MPENAAPPLAPLHPQCDPQFCRGDTHRLVSFTSDGDGSNLAATLEAAARNAKKPIRVVAVQPIPQPIPVGSWRPFSVRFKFIDPA